MGLYAKNSVLLIVSLIVVIGIGFASQACAWQSYCYIDGSNKSFWYNSFTNGAYASKINIGDGNYALQVVDPGSACSSGCLYTYCGTSDSPAVVGARFRVDAADTDWSTILSACHNGPRASIVLVKSNGEQHLMLVSEWIDSQSMWRSQIMRDMGLVDTSQFHQAYMYVTDRHVKLTWNGVETTANWIETNYQPENEIIFGASVWRDKLYSSNASLTSTVTFDWVGASSNPSDYVVPEPASVLALACGLAGFAPTLLRRRKH